MSLFKILPVQGLSVHRVNFQRVGPAEQIDVPSGSVQLVASATAAHWFDLPRFFKEVDRILCPNGVVALSCYTMECFQFVHPTKSKELYDSLYKVDIFL